MPIVTLPKMLTELVVDSPAWTEVRVHSRKDKDIYRELALLFPQIQHHMVKEGEPRWVFALFRDRDDEDLRGLPDDHVLDADERLSLIPMVGC
ncbi:MAG: hypothetical protein K8U57_38705 [Planctomycetes bacterium]|nr:hypothetical protein [Planctomycetota bacterium]